MNKIILLLLFNFILSQNEITTRQFNYFKSNEVKNIDFSELIDNFNGEYIIELISIKDADFKRTKRLIVETCDLIFNLSNENDKVKISRCNNKFNYEGRILINKDNHILSINYPKFDYLNCTFIFWISGNFIDVKVNTDISKNGILNEFYDDGTIKIEYFFNNGKKHGLQKRWYENGQLEILYNYDMGKLEGLQKKWHQNGILKGEWYYIDDKLNGIIKEWYPNKQLKFSKHYDLGVLVEVLEHY